MHTPSTRILSALAYDRGQEYDPGDPITEPFVEALALVDHARRVIGEDGPYERARQRRRERRRQPPVPTWFSAEDLLAAPWELSEQRFV